MFRRVSISNFKSIKWLEFEPRRVNVLIGEPNTGKSNVLEALATLCDGTYASPDFFKQILRFATVADLFFDHDLSEKIQICADDFKWELVLSGSQFRGRMAGRLNGANARSPTAAPSVDFLNLDHFGNLSVISRTEFPARYYRYAPQVSFHETGFGVLSPPFGSNLVALMTTNKRLRRLVGDLFRARGFRLVISPEKNELVLAKDVDDQLYNFSYPTISETLRRIVFFMAVLETNQNAILLLDEPEANTFPFYTTYLAERIALDETNQFFLTTHNPYVLGSIVSKTPAKDLAVFVASMDAYQTRLTPVTEAGLARIVDYGPDAFLNLERLTAA